jgi:hypothetical protein
MKSVGSLKSKTKAMLWFRSNFFFHTIIPTKYKC